MIKKMPSADDKAGGVLLSKGLFSSAGKIGNT